MIIRLKISGFKNLVNTELHLGAFNCIAGLNAVGKSNLFDAIRFLGLLADKPLLQAARAIRSEGRGYTEVRTLFHAAGDYTSPEMAFEVDMIIPATDTDDLGQKAEAAITTVKV